jgi:hypothetical protein
MTALSASSLSTTRATWLESSAGEDLLAADLRGRTRIRSIEKYAERVFLILIIRSAFIRVHLRPKNLGLAVGNTLTLRTGPVAKRLQGRAQSHHRGDLVGI